MSQRLLLCGICKSLNPAVNVNVVVTHAFALCITLEFVFISSRSVRITSTFLSILLFFRRIADDVETVSPILQSITERAMWVCIGLLLLWWTLFILLAA